MKVVPEPLGHKDHSSVLSFLQHQCISVPKRQNPVRLIFEKIELGAFLECWRPPLSIAGPIMAFEGL